MLRDVIDTFGKTTTAVNQDFVPKGRIETSTCHSFILEDLIWQSCLFRLRYFPSQCLRNWNREKRENEQVPATLYHSKN